MEAASEIEHALRVLDQETILESIRNFTDKNLELDPPSLMKAYLDVVTKIGIQIMISKLDETVMEEICESLEIESGRIPLETYLFECGPGNVLRNIHPNHLEIICSVLLLSSVDPEDLEPTIRTVCDEVTLCGMEEALKRLPKNLLESYVSQLDLQLDENSNHSKAILVEMLMVHIFSLEPKEELLQQNGSIKRKEPEKDLEKGGEEEEEEEEGGGGLDKSSRDYTNNTKNKKQRTLEKPEAPSNFEDRRTQLQNLMASLQHKADEFIRDFDETHLRLEERIQALDREKELVKAFKVDDGIVNLNVGGTFFTTSRSTLCKVEGTILSAMMNGRSTEVPKDETGRFFFDRSPEYFRIILEYLRTGYIDWPDTERGKKKLLAEFKDYGFDPSKIGEQE